MEVIANLDCFLFGKLVMLTSHKSNRVTNIIIKLYIGIVGLVSF